MHISEGVLSGPVLVAGAAVALAGTAAGLKKMELDRVPQAGMLAAAFFVGSLIHVPVGPSNVHLILNGIVGLLLRWAAFPAILTALLLTLWKGSIRFTDPMLYALALTAFTACTCGLINGGLISLTKVVPFIVTLGTMTIFLGSVGSMAMEGSLAASLRMLLPEPSMLTWMLTNGPRRTFVSESTGLPPPR